MRANFLSLVCVLSFVSMPVLATTTILDVYNASYFDLANKTIYGGIAGACTGTISTASTCNSCTGTTPPLTPCNPKSIHGALNLTVRFSSSVDLSNTPSNQTAVQLYTDVSGTRLPIQGAVAVGQAASSEYTLSVTWSQLCSTWSPGTGVALQSNCETSSQPESYSTKNLFVAVDEDQNNNFSDAEISAGAMPLIIHSINTATYPNATQNFCPGQYGAGNNGLCFYALQAGDEKLIIQESPEPPIYNPNQASGPSFYAAAFFALPADPNSPANSIVNFANGQVEPLILPFKSTSDLGLNSAYITGLENYQTYCVVAGQMNLAQNIVGFVTGNPDTSKMCGSPSEVVGLLDDRSCFISTAAFGSDMADEVVLFREFRNQYLLDSDLGRSFVHAYYKYSPPMADVIAGSETLKMIVRGFLYPLLVFSWLSLHIGIYPAVFFGLLFMIILFNFRRNLGQIFNRSQLKNGKGAKW